MGRKFIRNVGLAAIASLAIFILPEAALPKTDCGSGAGQVKDEALCVGPNP